MSKWICRDCGQLTDADEISTADGVCSQRKDVLVGNHNFMRNMEDTVMVHLAKQFVNDHNEKLPSAARVRCEEMHYQLMDAFALKHFGVYREICEAALRIDFNDANGKYNATVMREPSGNYWAIRLPGNEMKHESDTLEEAYAWVKEEKDGR